MKLDTNRPESQGTAYRERRIHRLRVWSEAIRRLEGHYAGVGPVEGIILAVRIEIELAMWKGEFGVFDDHRISELCETFSDSALVHELWHEEAASASAAYDRNRANAVMALDSGRLASIFVPSLVSGKDISTAYRVDDYMKLVVFGARLIRDDAGHAEIGPDGKARRTPKFTSLLPSIAGAQKITANPVRTDTARYTRAQGKAWTERLGWKPDTISKAAREMTQAEFDAWILKRESVTWPADKLAGRKLPGESDYRATIRLIAESKGRTRVRKPGKVAAVRAYAEAAGCSERKAFTLWGSQSVEAIQAEVSRLQRYGCHVCSDTSRGNTPFSDSSLSDVGMKVSRLSVEDRDLLSMWWEGVRGRKLSPEAIRKWRQRGKLEGALAEAESWARAWMREYRLERKENASRLASEQEDRYSSDRYARIEPDVGYERSVGPVRPGKGNAASKAVSSSAGEQAPHGGRHV